MSAIYPHCTDHTGYPVDATDCCMKALFVNLLISALLAVPTGAVPADSRSEREEVLRLLERATAGDEHAQFSLATAYDSGFGVKADPLQAAHWYEKAARQGHADARFNLAVLYDEGIGVEQDDRQAVYWYRQAAAQGMAEASNNLGLMYAQGRGVRQDYKRARDFFRQAADTGFPDAVYNLGLSYREGLGTSKNLLQAFALFAQIRTVHADAARAYDQLASHLTPQEQLTALQSLP